MQRQSFSFKAKSHRSRLVRAEGKFLKGTSSTSRLSQVEGDFLYLNQIEACSKGRKADESKVDWLAKVQVESNRGRLFRVEG